MQLRSARMKTLKKLIMFVHSPRRDTPLRSVRSTKFNFPFASIFLVAAIVSIKQDVRPVPYGAARLCAIRDDSRPLIFVKKNCSASELTRILKTTSANSTNMSICIVCKSYMNRKLRVLNYHESRIAHSLAAPLVWYNILCVSSLNDQSFHFIWNYILININ